MSILDRIIRKSAAASAMVMYRGGQAAPRTTNMGSLAREAYGKNPDVLSAVQGITTAAKGIEWGLLRVTSRAKQKGWTGDRVRAQLGTAGQLAGSKGYREKQRQLLKQRVLEPVAEHPLLDLLASPNPLTDWSGLVEAALGFYKVAGNSYLHMVGPDRPGAPPTELWVLRPEQTKIVVGDSINPVQRYDYGPGVGQQIPAEQVMHMRTFNPLPGGEFYGLPPLLAAAKRIDWSNAADDWNLALMQNGGQPAGAVTVDGTLTPPQRKDIKAWVDAEYMGKDNIGRPLLLEGGMDWKQLAITPLEAAWLQGGEVSTRKIAHVLGYPAVLLGDSSDRTYSNYGEARKALYQETVLPLLDMLRNHLNRKLTPLFGGDLLLAYMADDIEALQEDRDKLWGRVGSASHLTVDEKREATGYEALPGGIGNVVLVPFSVAPLRADPGPLPLEEDASGAEKGSARPTDTKAWALSTYDAKTEWWKAVEQMRSRAADRFVVDVQRQFKADVAAILTAMGNASGASGMAIAAERAVDAQVPAWTEMLRVANLRMAEPFAEAVLRDIEKSASGSKGDVPAPPHTDAADPELWQRYAAERLGLTLASRVQHITGTTRTQVRSALAEGIAAGDSFTELRDRITVLGSQFTAYRANALARTEAIRAGGLGQWAGAKSTGLPVEREWISTRDERVREAHLEAEGQLVGVDDSYTVDGESMMFPADDSLGASAGNTLQCRCTEAYSVVPE